MSSVVNVPIVTEAAPEATADDLLTIEEVARALRVSRSTVYRLIAAGELAAFRVGHQLRVDRVDLDRALAPAVPIPSKPSRRRR